MSDAKPLTDEELEEKRKESEGFAVFWGDSKWWAYLRFLATIDQRDKRIEELETAIAEHTEKILKGCDKIDILDDQSHQKALNILVENTALRTRLERMEGALEKIVKGSIIPSWQKGNAVEYEAELKCLGCICKRDVARQVLEGGK